MRDQRTGVLRPALGSWGSGAGPHCLGLTGIEGVTQEGVTSGNIRRWIAGETTTSHGMSGHDRERESEHKRQGEGGQRVARPDAREKWKGE